MQVADLTYLATATGEAVGSFSIPTKFAWSITAVAGQPNFAADDKLVDHIKIGILTGDYSAGIKADNIDPGKLDAKNDPSENGVNSVGVFWTGSSITPQVDNDYEFNITCTANGYTSSSVLLHLSLTD